MEIGLRLTGVLICIMLCILQVIAWYLGFNGQITVFVTSSIALVLGVLFGVKINLRTNSN